LSGMIIYMAIPIIWKKHISNSKSLNIFIISGNTYVFSSLSSTCAIQNGRSTILVSALILVAIVSFTVLVLAIHRVKKTAHKTNHLSAIPTHNYAKYLLITGIGIYITAQMLNFIFVRVSHSYFTSSLAANSYTLSILSSCVAYLIFYCYFACICRSRKVFWLFIIYITLMAIPKSLIIIQGNNLVFGYVIFNIFDVIFICIMLSLTVRNKKLVASAMGLSIVCFTVATTLFYALMYNNQSYHNLISQFIVFHMCYLVTCSSILILWAYEYIKNINNNTDSSTNNDIRFSISTATHLTNN
jgi:hypothetical protein